MEPELIGKVLTIPTPAAPRSEPRNTQKTPTSHYEARMRRRGFSPDHVARFDTPPHAEYDAVFDRVMSECGNESGAIFALAGRRGTGKTQLATNIAGRLLRPRDQECAITPAGRHYMRAVVDDESTWPLYSTAKDFFLLIKESWNPPEDGNRYPTESQVFTIFSKPVILIVDEAHVRSESKWEDDQLTELVDRRCYSGRDTILISNLGREAFGKALGPSIVSRIHERGELIECNWESFREPKHGT